MGNKVGRVAVFGLPLQQMWDKNNSGDFAPTYYLQTDAPLYYYSFTDAWLAMQYRACTPAEQARFDPMIIGFNPADMYAADHINRVLLTFPGVFSGIGEFTIHKEFVSSKIAGKTASLLDPALDRIFDFCGEAGLVAILHNDVDMPFPKPGQEPYMVVQMRDLQQYVLVERRRRTERIAGGSRRAGRGQPRAPHPPAARVVPGRGRPGGPRRRLHPGVPRVIPDRAAGCQRPRGVPGRLVPLGDGWLSLIGIPSTARLGAYEISLPVIRVPFQVTSRTFASETIPLTSSLTALRTQPDPRKTEEAVELSRLLAGADPMEVHETGAFAMPLAKPRRTGDRDRRGYRYDNGSSDLSVHNGVDLALPEGTPVTACGRGRVVMAKDRVVTGGRWWSNTSPAFTRCTST